MAFMGKYRIYVYAAILASICTSCFFAGMKVSALKSDLKIAKLELANKNKIKEIEDSVIEMERQAGAEIDRLNKRYARANSDYAEAIKYAQTQINQLNSDLSSSKRVLSSKVKACVQTSKTDNSGAVTTETRAELDSETARSLVGITSRCDEITLQLNALIEAVK